MEEKKRIQSMSLPVKLLTEEIVAMGQEMANAQQEKASLEREMKSVATEFKQKIAEKDARMGTLATLIANGYEHRSVEINWRFDWEKGTKTLIRLDTSVEVKTVMIEPHEKQMRLDDEVERINGEGEKKVYKMDEEKRKLDKPEKDA